MNKADVAMLLRCCERTVERQVRLNAFPPPQRFGKESLWFQSIVFGWLERRREQQMHWVASAAPSCAEAAGEPASSSTAPAKKARQSHAKPRAARSMPSMFSAEQLARIGNAVQLD